jgi:hypothetical protein
VSQTAESLERGQHALLAGTDVARGFRQSQGVGRHVRKGAKAVWIGVVRASV